MGISPQGTYVNSLTNSNLHFTAVHGASSLVQAA